MGRFYFISTYDQHTANWIEFLINAHPHFKCLNGYSEQLIEGSPKKLDDDQSIDAYISEHSLDNKSVGDVSTFHFYELYHKLLRERTKNPFTRIKLILSPESRVQLLLSEWHHKFINSSIACYTIEKNIDYYTKINHPAYEKFYLIKNFKNTVFLVAQQIGIDLEISENRLLALAIILVMAYDYTDLATPGKVFRYEDVISDYAEFKKFLSDLIKSEIYTDESVRMLIISNLNNAKHEFIQKTTAGLSKWQQSLLTQCIHTKFLTVHHPHIRKSLFELYGLYHYHYPNSGVYSSYSKLISIQLNSNRPAQLSAYFDNIEETVDDLDAVEVVVNIDDDDLAMAQFMSREINTRSFTIKYIASPKPLSLCDLWKPINQLLSITDPNAYFLLNISDEMLFLTKGWDSLLKKYVGLFPDHLFRLRASRNKFRHYYDRWECSFAQDSIPFTTKKWIDIGGNWNPCFGPDSYQQLISFYLAKDGQFSNEQYLRDIPILDIQLIGDIPSVGMDPTKSWRHIKVHLDALFICQSYPMQLEAKRRAMKIKSYINANALNLKNFIINDNKLKKCVEIIDSKSGSVLLMNYYKISRIYLVFNNLKRKINFYSYFGDGLNAHSMLSLISFFKYLKARNYLFYKLYTLTRTNLSLIKKAFVRKK